jgi:release factor glutamine methyltransferase
VSTTVGKLLCQGAATLRAAGIEEARAEARLLLGHVLGLDAAGLLARRHEAVEAAPFHAAIARRAAREPLAYITGRQGFWTLDLAVSPATLIPRADSESLVEAALAALPDRDAGLSVLDLGTGTGCLLLAILAERPNAFGVGVDLAPEAAALARANARATGLGARAAFLAGDWAGALAGRFDLVLSNPPYIESADISALMPEVAAHEPARALDGGADGLAAYRRLAAQLPGLLGPGGIAVLELGQGQRAAVSALMAGAELVVLGCRADLNGVDRALVVKKPIGDGPARD